MIPVLSESPALRSRSAHPQREPHAGGRAPGKASSSPGSPFNEPEINSEEGGIGGQHYSEKSQYDVACYHVSASH